MRIPITAKCRFEIFKRDGFTCTYCGARPPDVVLNIDHIIAVVNGGDNNPNNLTTACSTCNIGKGFDRVRADGIQLERIIQATINGIRFTTRTANLVGHASSDGSVDFENWSAGLYCSPRSGRFFLAGEGGLMTRWKGRERIFPLSKAEALAWSEQYLSVEEITAAFPESGVVLK